MQAERTGEPGQTAWSDIDWAAAEAAVRRLQDRIYRKRGLGTLSGGLTLSWLL